MTDAIITGAAFTGLVVALLVRGILPYLMKRKEAEELGQPIPSFSTTYMTTFIISIITGVMGIMVTVNELEIKLAGITSIMTAVAIGFSFSYSSLSLVNTFVDLKTDKIIAAKLGIIKTEEQQAGEAEDKIKTYKREQKQKQEEQPSS